MPFVLANVAAPLYIETLPLVPFIILLEGFVLWLFVKNLKVGFWMSVLVALIANITTSLIGTAVSIGTYGTFYEPSLELLMAFIASVLIEWGVFIFLFGKLKTLKKLKLRNKRLFMLSLYVNIASYALLIIFFGG